jgi:hypothetical protein
MEAFHRSRNDVLSTVGLMIQVQAFGTILR